MKQFPFFAPIVLRLGFSGVFVWFGTTQMLDPVIWTTYMPDIVVHLTGLSASTLVVWNGAFEVIMAILMVFGLWVRPVAVLLFLHMCGIVASVGLNSIGVRDVAIATGLLSIALYGNDIISWHYKLPTPPKGLLEETA